MTRRTKAKVGVKTARVLAEHPSARRATATVLPPVARVRFRFIRRRARRRAVAQAERLGEAARVAGSTLATYGPPAAEALGLVEPPKKRTPQKLAFGAVLGGAAVFLLDPKSGAARRAKLQSLAGGAGPAPAGPAAHTPVPAQPHQSPPPAAPSGASQTP